MILLTNAWQIWMGGFNNVSIILVIQINLVEIEKRVDAHMDIYEGVHTIPIVKYHSISHIAKLYDPLKRSVFVNRSTTSTTTPICM